MFLQSSARRLVALLALSLASSGCTALLGDFTTPTGSLDGGLPPPVGDGAVDAGPDATPQGDASVSTDGTASGPDGSSGADAGRDATLPTDAGSDSSAPADSGVDSTLPSDSGADSGQDASQDSAAACTPDSAVCTGGFLEVCPSSGYWVDAGHCVGPHLGNGSGVCSQNSCAIACDVTTPNLCNNSSCVNLASDPLNCGACGYDCTKLPNVGDPSSVTCDAGVCNVTNSCIVGYAHCSLDPVDSGCGTPITANPNCGICSTICTGGRVCGATDAGQWGCVATCGGSTPDTCPSGCVDLKTDHAHCGTCNTACSASQYCLDGGCGGACGPGQTDCNGNVTWTCNAGVEVPGIDCSGGNVATCVRGQCVGTCTSGVTECYASGGSANLQTCVPSGQNYVWQDAGACPAPTNGNGYSTCASATACGPAACAQGAHFCSASPTGACWDDSDQNHCGASCAVCPSGNSCVSGVCQAPCSPTLQCGGVCVDKTSDPQNCGTCGVSCGGGACTGGYCQPWVVLSPSTTPSITAAARLATDGTNIFWWESSTVPQIRQTTLLNPGTPITLGTTTALTGVPPLYVASGYVWSWVAGSSVKIHSVYNAAIDKAGSWAPLGSTFTDFISVKFGTGTSYALAGVQPTPSGGGGPFAYVQVTSIDSSAGNSYSIAPDPSSSGNGVTYSPSGAVSALAADLKYLYFSVDNATLSQAIVGGSAGATPLALATSYISAVSGLTTNGAYVAWANGGGAIYSLPETSPSTLAVTPATVATGLSSVGSTGLALDATYVYWPAGGSINYAPLAGGVKPRVLGSPALVATPAPYTVVVAGSFVVWNDTANNAICAIRAPQ